MAICSGTKQKSSKPHRSDSAFKSHLPSLRTCIWRSWTEPAKP